jgi:hypothetical protein
MDGKQGRAIPRRSKTGASIAMVYDSEWQCGGKSMTIQIVLNY